MEVTKGKLSSKHIIFIAITIITVITMIFTAPLPLTIREDTRGIYNTIESLPAGTKILILADSGMPPFATMNPSIESIYHHIIKKNFKFFVVTFSAAVGTSAQVQQFKDPGYIKKLVDKYNYRYGVDYVLLGFIPGWEAGMAAFARDIRSLCSSDLYGTPIGDLSLMSGIKSVADFDLIWLSTSYVATAEGGVRQWSIPYEKTTVCDGVRGLDATWAPWYPAIVKGMSIGTRGGAEYETLIGVVGGAATGRQTAISLVFLSAIAVLIIGNVRYFVERKKVSVERKVK